MKLELPDFYVFVSVFGGSEAVLNVLEIFPEFSDF